MISLLSSQQQPKDHAYKTKVFQIVVFKETPYIYICLYILFHTHQKMPIYIGINGTCNTHLFKYEKYYCTFLPN